MQEGGGLAGAASKLDGAKVGNKELSEVHERCEMREMSSRERERGKEKVTREERKRGKRIREFQTNFISSIGLVFSTSLGVVSSIRDCK